jgi:hypothetical protein
MFIDDRLDLEIQYVLAVGSKVSGILLRRKAR